MSDPQPVQRTEEHPLRYALIALITFATLWCITPRFHYFPRHGLRYVSTAGVAAYSIAALLCVAAFLWCPCRQWIQKCITGLASVLTVLTAVDAWANFRP
jgi:hypothetical protein